MHVKMQDKTKLYNYAPFLSRNSGLPPNASMMHQPPAPLTLQKIPPPADPQRQRTVWEKKKR